MIGDLLHDDPGFLDDQHPTVNLIAHKLTQRSRRLHGLIRQLEPKLEEALAHALIPQVRACRAIEPVHHFPQPVTRNSAKP